MCAKTKEQKIKELWPREQSFNFAISYLSRILLGHVSQTFLVTLPGNSTREQPQKFGFVFRHFFLLLVWCKQRKSNGIKTMQSVYFLVVITSSKKAHLNPRPWTRDLTSVNSEEVLNAP